MTMLQLDHFCSVTRNAKNCMGPRRKFWKRLCVPSQHLRARLHSVTLPLVQGCSNSVS